MNEYWFLFTYFSYQHWDLNTVCPVWLTCWVLGVVTATLVDLTSKHFRIPCFHRIMISIWPSLLLVGWQFLLCWSYGSTNMDDLSSFSSSSTCFSSSFFFFNFLQRFEVFIIQVNCLVRVTTRYSILFEAIIEGVVSSFHLGYWFLFCFVFLIYPISSYFVERVDNL